MIEIPLYHGSVADIKAFTPRDGWHAGGEPYKNGTLATDLKKYAMLYALKLKEGFSRDSIESALGGIKDAHGIDAKDYMHTNQVIMGTPCAVIRNRDKFLYELDKAGGGGYLYTVPSATFSPVKTKSGAATEEWLSHSTSVAPKHRERVTLEQAMHEGCQVLFVKDGVDFDKLAKANETMFDCKQTHVDFYKSLIDQGILVSENARRGILNALPFGEANQSSDIITSTARADGNPWTSMLGNRSGRSK